MSKTSIEKIIVDETKGLSNEALSEILDFIRFIKYKNLNRDSKNEFEKNINQNLSKLSQASLVHLENEFENYKELYPHES